MQEQIRPLDILELSAMTSNGLPTAEERARLIGALEEQVLVHGWSHARVAKTILRASAAVWSQIRAGKYPGDTDAYLRRAKKWFEDQAERAVIPQSDYVPTSIGESILRVCQRAWTTPCLAKIVLPSGMGKTAALREFIRRRNTVDQRAAYMQASQALQGPREFMAELCSVLKLKSTFRQLWTTGAGYRHVRDHLATYYDGGANQPFCLVVDEATTLSPKCLNILRNLHDDEGVRLGVVLADTVRLDVELSTSAGFAGGYEQLKTRFGAVYMPPPSSAIERRDVELLANAVADSLGYEGKLPKTTIDFLHKIAGGEGRFRNLVFRMQAVYDMAEQNQLVAEYTPEQLDFASELVTGRVESIHRQLPFRKLTDKPTLRAAV